MYPMFDPKYWILVGPAILLAIWASMRVQTAFAKWKRIPNVSGMTGAEAALVMLQRAGLGNVQIEQTHGMLSDHYDPRSRVLRLSRDVYNGRTVAAVGIALHEAGHALQHAHNYKFLQLRTSLVPVASIGGGYLSIILIFMGLAISKPLALVGLLLMAAAVAFSFITLPVELNASSRAKQAALQLGVVSPGKEAAGVSDVLNAAAWTYVAAAATALMQLLYWAMIVFGGRRD